MSEPINDGGPAFPCFDVNDDMTFPRGMTLRDYIAIHASDRDISDYTYKCDSNGVWTDKNNQAQARYAFADAMIKAREEKP